jgi:hypothetical protein
MWHVKTFWTKNTRAKLTQLKKGATVRYKGNLKERNKRAGHIAISIKTKGLTEIISVKPFVFCIVLKAGPKPIQPLNQIESIVSWRFPIFSCHRYRFQRRFTLKQIHMPIPCRFYVNSFRPKAVFQPMDQQPAIAEQGQKTWDQHQG